MKVVWLSYKERRVDALALRADERRDKPVSYTHLDVYKRQGEGRMDWQSAFGKVPSGVGLRCRAKGIPAVAIVGGIGDGAEKMYDFGVESIMSTINGAMDLEEALARAEELYAEAADRTFRMVRTGMKISGVLK